MFFLGGGEIHEGPLLSSPQTPKWPRQVPAGTGSPWRYCCRDRWHCNVGTCVCVCLVSVGSCGCRIEFLGAASTVTNYRPAFAVTYTVHCEQYVVETIRETSCTLYTLYSHRGRHAVAQLVETLRYKPEGRGFDSRWCHWIFFHWHNPSGRTMALGST